MEELRLQMLDEKNSVCNHRAISTDTERNIELDEIIKPYNNLLKIFVSLPLPMKILMSYNVIKVRYTSLHGEELTQPVIRSCGYPRRESFLSVI
jgi:hypothetical protein